MSRKTLLTETEIRQFLKLANLGGVGDTRIQEMGGYDMPGDRDEEELEEEEAGPEELEKFAADDMEDDTMMGDAEAADDELEADAEVDMGDDAMDMDAGGAGGQMVSVDDFMSALEGALEDALGEPVEVDMDEEPAGDDDEMEMDMEMGAVDDGGEMEMDMDVEEEPGMRNPNMYENQDDLVQEVAKRVAARLQAKNDKAEMVDALAERIMKRLTK